MCLQSLYSLCSVQLTEQRNNYAMCTDAPIITLNIIKYCKMLNAFGGLKKFKQNYLCKKQ